MHPDHPIQLRQKVLRRLAEEDDLDAVAREFGLSADLVFWWMKDNADKCLRLTSKAAIPRGPLPLAETGPPPSGFLRHLLPLYACPLVPMLLLATFSPIQTIVLHVTMSWFGFEQDHFQLLPRSAP